MSKKGIKNTIDLPDALDPAALLERIRSVIDERVAKRHWLVALVDTPFNYAYTVGLTELCGHPEVFMCGMPPDVALPVLNNIGKQIRDNHQFGEGAECLKALADNVPVAFRDLPQETMIDYGKLTTDRYGPNGWSAVQAFIPDTAMKFPWQSDCQPNFVKLQCLFGVGREPPATASLKPN